MAEAGAGGAGACRGGAERGRVAGAGAGGTGHGATCGVPGWCLLHMWGARLVPTHMCVEQKSGSTTSPPKGFSSSFLTKILDKKEEEKDQGGERESHFFGRAHMCDSGGCINTQVTLSVDSYVSSYVSSHVTSGSVF